MLPLVALLAPIGWGVLMSLISDTDTLGDLEKYMKPSTKIVSTKTYLGVRQALFLAWLKETAGGDSDGGGVGKDGGGTDVSTLAGRGTTPDMV